MYFMTIQSQLQYTVPQVSFFAKTLNILLTKRHLQIHISIPLRLFSQQLGGVLFDYEAFKLSTMLFIIATIVPQLTHLITSVTTEHPSERLHFLIR